MNIEDAILPVPNEVGRKNFHKAGEYHEVDFRLFEVGLEGGFRLGAVPIIDCAKRQAVATSELGEGGMISSDEDGVCVEATGFPSAEDGFGGMGFLGDEDGETAAALGSVGKAKGEAHAELASDGVEASAGLGFVEPGGGPGGEEAHTKFATGDLLFEGFDIGAELEKLLGDGGDGARAVGSDKSDGKKGATGHG